MIFDSENQKQQILKIILESPVKTNIEGILSGPSDDLVDLVSAVQSGTIDGDEKDEE